MTLIDLLTEQKTILEQFARCRSNPHWLVTRSQILLHMAAGFSIKQTARQLQVSRNQVRRWLRRWIEHAPHLEETAQKQEGDSPLSEKIEAVLSDEPRIGRPITFSAEAMVQIVALACEAPQTDNRPLSHWTPTELAKEVV